MFFKNMSVFKMSQTVDPEQLSALLDAYPFRPCPDTHVNTVGFTSIYGGKEKLIPVGRFLVFCLMKEEKIIPSAGVKTKWLRKIEELEIKNNCKLGKQDRKELKERVYQEMVKDASTKITETWAYIDAQKQLLVLNSSSAKHSEEVCALLRKYNDGTQIFPYRPQQSVGVKMTYWLSEDDVPSDLLFGDKCELTDGNGKIRYQRRTLEDDLLRTYLKDGMTVVSVLLQYRERIEFVLRDDFMISQIALTDLAMEDADNGADKDSAYDTLQANITLFANEASDLLDYLIEVMGGELEPAPII